MACVLGDLSCSGIFLTLMHLYAPGVVSLQLTIQAQKIWLHETERKVPPSEHKTIAFIFLSPLSSEPYARSCRTFKATCKSQGLRHLFFQGCSSQQCLVEISCQMRGALVENHMV